MGDNQTYNRSLKDESSFNKTPQPRNGVFWSILFGFAGVYMLLIVALLVADLQFSSFADLKNLINDRYVRYSICLSVLSSTVASVMAMWIAVPTGYWLARFESNQSTSLIRRFTKKLIFALLDIPIVLPPIVVGISLLVLFQTPFGQQINAAFLVVIQSFGFDQVSGITYEIPAVILAQFTVVTAFAIRTMRRCFAQIDPRPEQVARTLGASDYQAFAKIAFPQSIGGMVAAFTLAWARAIGEFGPVLIFAGTTRLKTEVLPTTIYLSFQSGDLRSAVSASMILISVALIVLILVRWFAPERTLS